jgi:hypothetical protein
MIGCALEGSQPELFLLEALDQKFAFVLLRHRSDDDFVVL